MAPRKPRNRNVPKQPRRVASTKKKRPISEAERTRRQWHAFAEHARIVQELEQADNPDKVRALFKANPAYRRILMLLGTNPHVEEQLMVTRNELLQRARQRQSDLGEDLRTH